MTSVLITIQSVGFKVTLGYESDVLTKLVLMVVHPGVCELRLGERGIEGTHAPFDIFAHGYR
jgi:hypothetical protein